MTKTNQLAELEPGEIPPYWRSLPYKVLQHAMTFGLVIPGYTCKNYVERAVETMGYETLLEWGVQGSGKSNRILQQGYWVYEDWDEVLKNLMFKPSAKERGFVQALKNIPYGKRIPWIGWDDVGVHFPSVSWRTDIEKYAAVDSAWAAIRTKVNVISLTIPLIDRTAKNIKDNVTIEEFLGRNQTVLIERYIRLPGLKRVESNFWKLQLEPIHKFELFDVPTDVFKEYWEMRLELAEEALTKLGNIYSEDEVDLDNYVPMNVVVKELGISPNTLCDLAGRKGIRSRKFNGQLHILKEDYEDVLVSYYKKSKRGKYDRTKKHKEA